MTTDDLLAELKKRGWGIVVKMAKGDTGADYQEFEVKAWPI